jgi:hypothetical protein
MNIHKKVLKQYRTVSSENTRHKRKGFMNIHKKVLKQYRTVENKYKKKRRRYSNFKAIAWELGRRENKIE